MNKELIIIAVGYIGSVRMLGYELSGEQTDRIMKLITSEQFEEVASNFADNSQSDSLLVDAAIAYLEKNL